MKHLSLNNCLGLEKINRHAALNLFGQDIKYYGTGSRGTPEFGLTEAVGNLFNQGRTSQGGSNLFQSSTPQPQQNPAQFSFGDLNQMSGFQNFGTPTSTQFGGNGGGGGGGGGGGTGGNTSFGLKNEMVGALRDVGGVTYRHLGNDVWSPIGISGQGGSGDQDAALEAMYGGAKSALDAQQQALEGQQPIAISEINAAGEKQKTPFTQMGEKGKAAYQGQESDTRQAESNAMQQARQLYNELSQYNLSRFGGGSSAGGAAQELLGRGVNQQMGAATNAASSNIQKIKQASQQLDEFVSTKLGEINTDVQNQVTKAQQWFRDQINQINSSRAGLESDKAAKRYEALRSREDFLNNMKAMAYQQQLQLQGWAQQRATELGSAGQAYAQGMPTYDTGTVNAAAAGLAGVPRAGEVRGTAPQQTQQGQQYGGRFRVMPNGDVVDEYGNVVATSGGEQTGANLPEFNFGFGQ